MSRLSDGTACATFTITDWLVLPPAPVAVNTYVVVCCGVTPEMLPVTGNTDELIDGTIVTEVAFEGLPAQGNWVSRRDTGRAGREGYLGRLRRYRNGD